MADAGFGGSHDWVELVVAILIEPGFGLPVTIPMTPGGGSGCAAGLPHEAGRTLMTIAGTLMAEA